MRRGGTDIGIGDICSRLVVGTLVRYLDIYSVAQDEPPVGIASAIPNECVGMIVDVFAAVTERLDEHEDGLSEEIFWNYEIYRTEGFREVITSEDVEWLAVNDNFTVLYSPEDKKG